MSSRQPSVGRRAVAGTGHQQDARVGLENQPVQARVNQIDARDGAPVAEQTRFDVLGLERLLQHVIALEVDHRRGDVVGRATIKSKALRRRRWRFS
jgi:hypothetical protein